MVVGMKQTYLKATFFLALIGQQVFADTVTLKAQQIIDDGKKICESDGGAFSMEPNAQATFQFTSGDTVEYLTVVNENYFNCSSTASLYGGSAGAVVHIITKEDYKYGYSRAIEVVTAFNGTPLILLGLHGMSCGEVGYKPCIQAITIFEGKFLTPQ